MAQSDRLRRVFACLVAMLMLTATLSGGCAKQLTRTDIAADYIRGVVALDREALVRATGHDWSDDDLAVMREDDLGVSSVGAVEIVGAKEAELPPPDMVLGDSSGFEETGCRVEYRVAGESQTRQAMVELLVDREGQVLATGAYSLD